MSVLYRSAQADEPAGTLHLVEDELPEPGPGQVRVSVEAAESVNPTPRSSAAAGATFPLVPGHEIAGRIDAIGDSVQGFAPGERVAVGWFGGNCGYCVPCRKATSSTAPGCRSRVCPTPAGMLTPLWSPPRRWPVFRGVHRAGCRPHGLRRRDGVRRPAHQCRPARRPGRDPRHRRPRPPGVQFAARLGFETIAIARGADKEPLAKQRGAHHYIDNQAQDTAAALQALGGAKVVLGIVTSNAAMTDTPGGSPTEAS